MTATPYPLAWPAGRPRRSARARKAGRFSIASGSAYGGQKDITIADALRRLQEELDRIGARYPVVSSNVETRVDGLPRSGGRKPDDPGVAVYFQLKDKPVCMPCDTYCLVEHNIAAIAAHIEATRKIERHGVATIAEMFSGFVALPPSHRPWFDVLGLKPDATKSGVMRAHRRLSLDRHPDRGGNNADMADINRARDEALRELT